MRRSVWATLLAMLLSLLLTQVARAASVTQTWSVGNEPFGVTIDPRDGKVYVAVSNHFNSGLEYMPVIDPTVPPPPPSALPPASWIQLPSTQVMSVLDTGLDRLFVPLANRNLAIVDVPSHSIVGMVANGGSLAAALDATTHHVYATSGDGGISVTDGATGTLLAHASAGFDSYWAVAQNAGRHRVYVANLNMTAPSVIVLDDRDLTEIGRVALPEVPRLALAVDAARGLVYVGGLNTATGFPGGHLYAIDETSLAITKSIDVGLGRTAPISITFDVAGDSLYLSNIGQSQSLGEIVVVNAASLAVVKRAPLTWQPGQSALHPDGHLYVAGFSTRSLVAMSLVNQPPAITGVFFSPPTPDTSSLLRADASVSDPDSYPLTLTYEWFRNGTSISGASGPVLDLAASGNGDLGDTISVRVSVTDGESVATREASVVVGNATPTLAVSLDSTSPLTNDVLHASALATDADGDAVTLAYSWTRNGATITGANSPSLDLAFYGDRGDVIGVRVNADDGHGGVTSQGAAATVADSAPTVALSLSRTQLHTDDVLQVTATGLDADRDALVYGFAFRVNGVLVQCTCYTSTATATFDLRLPGHGDRGDAINVEVVAGDGTLWSAPATGSASVSNTPPVGSVSLSDYSPTKKDPLVAYGSVFDADGDSVLMTYTWKVSSKVKLVVGPTSATSSSFDLRELQPGDVVTVTVTPASDGFDPGLPASATAVVRLGK